MSLKTFKPTTPSLRSRRIIKNPEIWKGSPYKPLTKGFAKKGGRNNQGRITVRHRGGGSKKVYRQIDFKRTTLQPAQVQRIEYDPNRSGFIALIRTLETNHYSYMLAPEGITAGTQLIPGSLSVGSTLPLHQIPLGSVIHNIETTPGSGGKLSRSAGTSAILLSKKEDCATLVLPSKQNVIVSAQCQATLGKVSNPDHLNYIAGKAGVSRWLGFRPTVRGEAMNPIDHPHGGKTKGHRIPRTPWGKITRGKKTKK